VPILVNFYRHENFNRLTADPIPTIPFLFHADFLPNVIRRRLPSGWQPSPLNNYIIFSVFSMICMYNVVNSMNTAKAFLAQIVDDYQ